MNTRISKSGCHFGIDATGSVSLHVQWCIFAWLKVGAIVADFAVDVNIQHASFQNSVRFLKARSVQRVRLQSVYVFCTPLSRTRCIDLDFQTEGAQIQFDDVQLHHRVSAHLGGDSVVLHFPIDALWPPGSANPMDLTCSPGSYPEFSLTDEDHWEVKTVPSRSKMDCSTLLPAGSAGCCMTFGGAGHVMNNSVHRHDLACTTSFPCLCLDAFCNSCTVRSRMRVFRATCSPCEYGTVSPASIHMPLVFNNIALGAGPYKRIKNWCIDCATLAESVDALIACARGEIEVPRGVMVTLHSLQESDDRPWMLAWRCPNPAACPGQRHQLGGYGLEDQCSPGHAEGIAGCVACDSGYGRKINDPFVCQQCPPIAFQWLLLALKHVGLFGVGMMSAQRARRRTSVIFKIMVSFGTASFMSSFEYHTAKVSLRSYIGLTEAATSTTSLYSQSYECLFPEWHFDFYRLAMLEVSPPLLLLLSCWIWTWVASHCGFRHPEVVMIQGTLVLGNAYMANVCAGFAKPLSCFQMNKSHRNGKALQRNSFIVWEECRPLHAQAIAGVGVFVCILIVPVYWLEMIRRSRDWHSASRRKIMGFLVSHYRPGVEWWELVPLLRKVLLLQVRVFSPPSYAASTNLTLTLAVLVSSLLLHVVVWPYEDSYLNRIEGSALAASVTALLLASLAVTQEWDKPEALTMRYLISLCIVLVIGTMMLMVLLIGSLVEQVQNRRWDLNLTKVDMPKFRNYDLDCVRIDELGCFDLEKALAFLEEHFSRAGTFSEDLSLDDILASAAYKASELKSQGGLHGLMIDPYNCIEMPDGFLSETQVVSTMMSKLQQFAKRYSSHVWIVVHPTKGSQLAGNEPSMYDCCGSAHWFNKCDNGIIVRRPFAKSWAQQMQTSIGSSRQVDIKVDKVRNCYAGHLGTAKLIFNPETRGYEELQISG
ncbi:Twinkle-like protein, chloroplastic/mitochondrial [Symbiodinium microadriaticum]|uniref:Twinkle-like protein, chloroplastic/mitochondrial n=1 Tax=Symbiodinium microadriaticum TaxID=2951 RepID=A0A1Q9E8A6_SYMMI|nr:Twinkle-like protein, chloroplastic/mitochondrial [Symbiodinium microadriaticum]